MTGFKMNHRNVVTKSFGLLLGTLALVTGLAGAAHAQSGYRPIDDYQTNYRTNSRYDDSRYDDYRDNGYRSNDYRAPANGQWDDDFSNSRFENSRYLDSRYDTYRDDERSYRLDPRPQFEGAPERRRGSQYRNDSRNRNEVNFRDYFPSSRDSGFDDRDFPGYENPTYRNPEDRYQSNYTPSLRDLRDPGFRSPNNRTPTFLQPGTRQPIPAAPVSQVNPADEIQLRITQRYQNSGFRSLLDLPVQSSLAMYTEVLQLIDERHLQPTPVSERVERGFVNLREALRNPAFTQANRMNVSVQQADQFASSLMQTSQQYPARNAQEAINVANWAGQQAQQQIGLRPSAVIMEFVYAAGEVLDKYSTFVPPERVPGASLQMEESVVGIGVQVEAHDLGVKVMKVISDSPAKEAGLRSNDVIVAVGGQRLTGMELDRTVELITGRVGTSVALEVERDGQQRFAVNVPRRSITLHTVNDVQMLGTNSRVGYFKLDKFAANSASEMDAALWTLHNQGMQSLIIDLRGNPGGLLTSAIEISNKFLPQGKIVSTRGRNASDNSQETASRAQTWKVPLVLLTDHGSASASEILAAAIQENGRGVIVGRTTYGKGTVQTQFPLKTAGTALRITTAKFYSPQGREMAGAGVTPDFNVPETNGSNQDAVDIRAAVEIAERQLQGNQNLTGSQFRQLPVPGGV